MASLRSFYNYIVKDYLKMGTEIKKLKDLQNTEYGLEKLFSDAEDFLPLLGTD